MKCDRFVRLWPFVRTHFRSFSLSLFLDLMMSPSWGRVYTILFRMFSSPICSTVFSLLIFHERELRIVCSSALANKKFNVHSNANTTIATNDKPKEEKKNCRREAKRNDDTLARARQVFDVFSMTTTDEPWKSVHFTRRAFTSFAALARAHISVVCFPFTWRR